MSSTKPSAVKKTDKEKNIIDRINIYKSTAEKAIDESSKFDAKLLDTNSNYMDVLTKADKEEYDILKLMCEKTDIPEERKEIMERMKEMKKERYNKDSENKKFLEEQLSNHKNHNLQILGSLAVVVGLVYTFRKPIFKSGKSLISKI